MHFLNILDLVITSSWESKSRIKNCPAKYTYFLKITSLYAYVHTSDLIILLLTKRKILTLTNGNTKENCPLPNLKLQSY